MLCLSIHQLMDIGDFSTLGYYNYNPAMNNCIQVLVWTYVFISLKYIPSEGFAGSNNNFIFLRNSWIVFQNHTSFYIPTSSV